MRVSIIGLEHLGVVTAACAANHHDIKIWDGRPEIISLLLRGLKTWPHEEPGINSGFIANLVAHNLASILDQAVEGAEIIWVTYDTPVSDDEMPNYVWVSDRIQEIFPLLKLGQILLISSQVCCGFTEMIQTALYKTGVNVGVYCSPENIRRGRALETFCHQKRILVGASDDVMSVDDSEKITALLTPFCEKVMWLPARVAEMSKHVLNAFLAMTIAFTNEVGTLCELYDVSPAHIQQALISEGRIGIGLPLRYGEPYSGGTLGRDVETLNFLTRAKTRYLPLLKTINASNDLHKVRCEQKPTTDIEAASAD